MARGGARTRAEFIVFLAWAHSRAVHAASPSKACDAEQDDETPRLSLLQTRAAFQHTDQVDASNVSQPGMVWKARQQALAAVIHFEKPGVQGSKGREGGLRRTLDALSSLAVPVKILLVSNVAQPNVADLVSEQILRPTPQCGPAYQNGWCMGWEAIAVLREHASTGRCDLGRRALCGPLAYQYYLLVESDVEVPAPTFDFWRARADRLFGRGYLLLPHRRDLVADQPWSLTDLFRPDHANRTVAVVDGAADAELDENPRDRVYIRPGNPYAGCWMMTRAQFAVYMEGSEWNYTRSHYEQKAFMPFEGSMWGLLADPRYEPEKKAQAPGVTNPEFRATRALTHLRMPVYHQFPMHGSEFHTNTFTDAYFRRLVDDCVEGRGPCETI